MAVNVNFNGRLGADCEQKSTANGKPYISMRVATDEFKNGNKDTAWLNVVDYSDKGLKMSQFLKKGSLVNVIGIETIRQYQTKDNRIGFSRDVVADRIDFVRSGNNNKTEDAASTIQSGVQDTAHVAMDCGTFVPPHTNHDESASPNTPFIDTSNDYDDDLPF